MNQKKTKKYSHKQGAVKLMEIVNQYRKANILISMKDKKVYMLNDHFDDERMKEYSNYKMMFDAFFNTLQEDEKLVIMNDFYEMVSVNWWIGLYSRSTYYRIKNKAIEKMLFYYE